MLVCNFLVNFCSPLMPLFANENCFRYAEMTALCTTYSDASVGYYDSVSVDYIYSVSLWTCRH